MNSAIWTFGGICTEAGNKIVQKWYDSLPDEEYEALQDMLNYLSVTTDWKRPEFDKVLPPLHEIRTKANKKNHEIRVYGVFHPDIRRRFVMLNGTMAKKRSNDRVGQDITLQRLRLWQQGKAKDHEFIVESRLAEPDQKK